MNNPYNNSNNNKKRRKTNHGSSSSSSSYFIPNHNHTTTKSECYAVVSGRQDGIYFSREEMMVQKQGHPLCMIRSFKSINEAKRYLEQQHGLIAVETGGWITTDGRPILYTKQRSGNNNNNNNNNSNVATRDDSSGSTASSKVSPMNSITNRYSPLHSIASTNTTKSIYSMDDSNPEEEEQEQDKKVAHRSPLVAVAKKNKPTLKEIIEIDSSDSDNDEKNVENKRNTKAAAAGGKRTKHASKRLLPKQKKDDLNNEVIRLDSDDNDSEEYRPDAAGVSGTGEIEFDTIQQEAIDAAFEGRNVFITGVAGTGKSLVTTKIVNDAKAMRKEIAVAAPTGS
jgi:viroplasmin and RNaseH domain-containing protein